MTATIIAWDQFVQTSSEKVEDGVSFATPRTIATPFPEQESQYQQARTTNSSPTVSSTTQSADNEVSPLPINRIYPHVFDESNLAGQALIYLQSAITDAKEAIDAFGEPDLQEVTTRLTHIAAAMGKAHLLTEFNESFGGVVSYVRRATLLITSEDISRSALNSLLQALMSVAANPMLDLDEATDLIDKLAHDGWKGEHRLANELIMALTEDSEITTEELQSLLFEVTETTEGREET